MPIEETLFHETLLTFATAMVPVLELRGAIPVGVAAGLSPAAACAAAILWTGALVASLLDIRMRHAIPAIFAGVVIAGLIITLLTAGVIHLF